MSSRWTNGPRFRLSYDQRVLGLALLAGLPASIIAVAFLVTSDLSPTVRWGGTLVVLGTWLVLALAVRRMVVRPLQTLANLLSALRQEDFTIEARGADRSDVLGLVLAEAGDLREVLRDQRLGALEASALLRKVVAEIDMAVFAFDGEGRLRLVNRAAERLLGRPRRAVLGESAEELGLARFLEGEPKRTFEGAFPGAGGRFELRRTPFRQAGRTHHLLVLSDLSRVLREEERQAWRRLIRVFSHEINNSLTPIRSIAGSLQDLLVARAGPPGGGHEHGGGRGVAAGGEGEGETDLREGLQVIARRAESLQRFMTSYARLARLPPPEPRPMDVGDWIRRTVRLETRRPIAVREGPELTIEADADQLEQMLINLVQNAADAVQETDGRLEVGWARRKSDLEVWVLDEGPGITGTANLFVPFFTTKPTGSGIGLVLGRQIAEAHGGSLVLENRDDRSGCRARVVLPLE